MTNNHLLRSHPVPILAFYPPTNERKLIRNNMLDETSSQCGKIYSILLKHLKATHFKNIMQLAS